MDSAELRAGDGIRRGLGDRLDRFLEIGTRSGERRRRHRRRAVRRMKVEDALVRIRIAVCEVRAIADVHVHIDETGDDQAAHAIGRRGRDGDLHDVGDRRSAQ